MCMYCIVFNPIHVPTVVQSLEVSTPHVFSPQTSQTIQLLLPLLLLLLLLKLLLLFFLLVNNKYRIIVCTVLFTHFDMWRSYLLLWYFIICLKIQTNIFPSYPPSRLSAPNKIGVVSSRRGRTNAEKTNKNDIIIITLFSLIEKKSRHP